MAIVAAFSALMLLLPLLVVIDPAAAGAARAGALALRHIGARSVAVQRRQGLRRDRRPARAGGPRSACASSDDHVAGCKRLADIRGPNGRATEHRVEPDRQADMGYPQLSREARRVVEQQRRSSYRAERPRSGDVALAAAPARDPRDVRRGERVGRPREREQRFAPRLASHRHAPRRATDLVGKAPGKTSAPRGLGRKRFGLVERQIDHAASPSAPSASISSISGSPAKSAMRSQRSDLGSKLRAPKKASLARNRSTGRKSAPIKLSQISA